MVSRVDLKGIRLDQMTTDSGNQLLQIRLILALNVTQSCDLVAL